MIILFHSFIILLFYQINCLSRSRASNYQYSVWMIKNLWPIHIIFMFSFVTRHSWSFFCFFYVDTHLFFFSGIISSFVLCAYASLESTDESTDCILWLLIAVNVILLTSSVNTLCFSILNTCCDFSINLLL